MKKSGARLGQHFLIHSWAARKLAYAAKPLRGETILEIGPGKGVLTKELLQLGPVVAIEKDERLVAQLRETFSNEIASGKLRIVEGDVRDISPLSLGLEKYVLAANIPYYITGEIIRQFLTANPQPRAMALHIQKEVAQRIVSSRGGSASGGSKESILSISVKAFGTPKIIEKVSKSHFSPPPSVDSAILAVDNISKNFFADVDEQHFFAVVRAGFASKRKFFSNNLSTVFDKDHVRSIMSAVGVRQKERAENVTLTQWKKLAQLLT